MTTYNFVCLTSGCQKDKIPITLSNQEKDDPMYCAKCEQQLKRVGQRAFTVKGSKVEEYNKQVKYLKSRATKHAKSPEGKHLRHEAIKREMGSMGYEKK